MRTSEIYRKTAETEIRLKLSLDGSGQSDIRTGCGFLDHMLTLFSAHGRFDLTVACCGDTEVDFHHTAEDLGIVLGSAFDEALGDRKGIHRYGSIILPMDETLMLCAVDISGRDWLEMNVIMPSEKVGTFDTELVKEFFLGFVRRSRMTLHFRMFAGENTHHIIESMFKAFGRVTADACGMGEDSREIPSTKGVI